jgi:hypothetical protein
VNVGEPFDGLGELRVPSPPIVYDLGPGDRESTSNFAGVDEVFEVDLAAHDLGP